ncbi:MAG: hypothetical protein ABIO35_11685 [Nitrobacter sp.]
MASWIEYVIAGCLLFIVSFAVYRARSRNRAFRHRLGNPENREMEADRRAQALISVALVTGLTMAEPSSVYQGTTIFFDSIEHRDMFEANNHRPVHPQAQASSVKHNGRPVERSSRGNSDV